MPVEDDDGPLDEGAPAVRADKKSAPPARQDQPSSRFHPRFLKEAEKYGLSQEDIEACKDNAELRGLIEFERSSVAEERSRQAGRGGDRSQQARPEPTSPPTPSPEPEWTLSPEAEAAAADEIKAELKRLGKALLKATKNGDKDRLEELQEEIKQLKDEREVEKIKNSPFMRKVNKVLAQYENLFGTEDERAENPTGRKAQQFRWLDEAMTERKAQGKLTGDVEKDLHTTIAQLFPGAKAGGTDAAPTSQTSVKTRAQNWGDAGTPPASHRNGADQSGKPGGKKAAAAKVREQQRAAGFAVEDDFDDLEDDDI
jgi:hypothetical protein